MEVPGEGVMDMKMRVFVTNSEDAKAVNDYIRTHEKQVRAAVCMYTCFSMYLYISI